MFAANMQSLPNNVRFTRLVSARHDGDPFRGNRETLSEVFFGIESDSHSGGNHRPLILNDTIQPSIASDSDLTQQQCFFEQRDGE